jgi:nicotinamide-nucleotide amidase
VPTVARAVKQELLEVSDGPLVSQRCVSEITIGAAALLSADVGLAITGLGGPEPDEGHEAETVWMAVHAPLGSRSVLYHLRGNYLTRFAPPAAPRRLHSP